MTRLWLWQSGVVREPSLTSWWSGRWASRTRTPTPRLRWSTSWTRSTAREPWCFISPWLLATCTAGCWLQEQVKTDFLLGRLLSLKIEILSCLLLLLLLFGYFFWCQAPYKLCIAFLSRFPVFTFYLGKINCAVWWHCDGKLYTLANNSCCSCFSHGPFFSTFKQQGFLKFCSYFTSKVVSVKYYT